jgi:hypothetical protein
MFIELSIPAVESKIPDSLIKTMLQKTPRVKALETLGLYNGNLCSNTEKNLCGALFLTRVLPSITDIYLADLPEDIRRSWQTSPEVTQLLPQRLLQEPEIVSILHNQTCVIVTRDKKPKLLPDLAPRVLMKSNLIGERSGIILDGQLAGMIVTRYRRSINDVPVEGVRLHRFFHDSELRSAFNHSGIIVPYSFAEFQQSDTELQESVELKAEARFQELWTDYINQSNPRPKTVAELFALLIPSIKK